jgi:hypothetical protein
MRRRLVAAREDASAFERDVDAELAMRQRRRILDRGDEDLLAVDDDRVALDLHVLREAAMDAVEAQQMRIGLDRAEIVDGDTTSMSVRPDSTIARRMLRPIRPNPLIATRTAMIRSPWGRRIAPALSWPAGRLEARPKFNQILVSSRPSAPPRQRRIRGDAEIGVELPRSARRRRSRSCR